MFLTIFRDRRRAKDDDVEMIDLDALRARIGECRPPTRQRRREQPIERIDGPRPSQPRSWRDAAGLSR